MTQALGYVKYAFIDTPSDFARWFLVPKGAKNCALKSVFDRIKSVTAVVFLAETFLSVTSPALKELVSAFKIFGSVTKVALVTPNIVDAVSEVRVEPKMDNLNDEPFANKRLAVAKRVIAVFEAVFGGAETVCTLLAPFQVPVLGAVLNVATVVNTGVSLVSSGISMTEDVKSWYNLRARGFSPILPAEAGEVAKTQSTHFKTLAALEKVYATAGKVLGLAASIIGIIGTIALFVATAPAIPFYVVPVCLAGVAILGLFSKYVKEAKENLLIAPQLPAPSEASGAARPVVEGVGDGKDAGDNSSAIGSPTSTIEGSPRSEQRSPSLGEVEELSGAPLVKGVVSSEAKVE